MSAVPPSPLQQACAILYDGPPALDADAVQQALQRLGARASSVAFAAMDQGAAPSSGQVLRHGRAHIDGIELHLTTVAAPADDAAMQLALHAALLAEDDRAALLAHRAYLYCATQPSAAPPLAQLRALYRLAGALVATAQAGATRVGGAALGVVDVPALHAIASADLLEVVRWLDADPPPLGLWVRPVGVGGGRGDMWLLTRGLAHFGAPELAVTGRDARDPESAEALLMSVALWVVQGTAALAPGHTLEMVAEEGSGLTRWRCRAPQPEERWLAAPYGTLVLAPA